MGGKLKHYFFTFSAASTKQCQDRNAMIQFSVFDKDIITADDFGGETYFPLSAVPGIHSLRYINDYK